MAIQGSVALVTGGASGIGKATVVALARRGASVVVVDRDEDGAAKAGVVSFTRALEPLAQDWGIRVNAICPELVDTPLALGMGEERMAELRASQSVLTPDEVANCVVALSGCGVACAPNRRDVRGEQVPDPIQNDDVAVTVSASRTSARPAGVSPTLAACRSTSASVISTSTVSMIGCSCRSLP